ncbi:MAG: hypothetical protein GF383_03610 [Candidatus Lokiarchaeota archaeon]|nr:hypothetical protein [Candidatus Lokiarchaeota archaeon]MBD3338757.1 hypothetical protein [Candidatus Lokiarchaeota archaeon]
MVATINEKNLFKRSRKLFEKGDINNSLDYFEKAISHIDKSEKRSDYLEFLQNILEYTRKNNLPEEESLVLRTLAKTYSAFNKSSESLKYHEQSLKIQRTLGKKLGLAEGLVFLAEDLEVTGEYEKCIKVYEEASDLFHNLGKLRKTKDIKKELKRLKEFSREIFEDEYIMSKFHVDKY